MKYGVITCTGQQLALDGRDWLNVGDYIQQYAMESLYQEWGIEDYERVGKYKTAGYDRDEYVILPYTCWNELNSKLRFSNMGFPLSHKILPVYFSFHLHSSHFGPEIRQNFLLNGPVGCRDERTMKIMRENAIPAYLSGCVTSLLPRRTKEPKEWKAAFIDIPKKMEAGVEQYIPEEIRNRSEYFSHKIPLNRTGGSAELTEEENKRYYKQSVEQLLYYRDQISLVVTSRLHAAAPCMAMGIPVILVNDDFDERYAWIDKYLPLYNRERFSEIDWNPKPVEYEAGKQMMKRILKRKIDSVYEANREIYELSEFYETRERGCGYNSILYRSMKEYMKKTGRNSITYAMWGSVNQTTTFYYMMKEYFPESRLIRLIDKKCEGSFEGIPIVKEAVMDSDEKEMVYFIMAESAHKPARDYLKEHGRECVLVHPDMAMEYE